MGCTLNYTAKDHEQAMGWFEKEVKSTKTDKKRREEIRTSLKRASSTVLVDILSKPAHPAFRAVKILLAKSVGSKMTHAETERLPDAFRLILQHSPSAMGIFEAAPSHRGPGASAISHHYEVFSTAALMQNPFETKNGKFLSISPTDKVDFGIKFSRGYAQPKRYETIEADVLVYKDFKTIAIDAKYSETGKYGVPNKGELQRQLGGIRTGLLRDDKFQEFVFITNGVFGDKFKEMVKEENLNIARDYAKSHNRLYHDAKHPIDKQDLPREERENTPPDKIPESFFREYNPEVEKFISQYHIVQIDMCEHVQFPGT